MDTPDPMATLVDSVAARLMTVLQPKIDQALSIRPRLLTVESAAAYLGRTPNAVRHLIVSRAIPVVKTGSRVHLDIKDLDRWIDASKLDAAA